MFRLLTGSLYPHLESSLVDTIRRFKTNDPSAPLAVLVPSDSLRRRLQWLLCVQHDLALYDVSFLTFHQLALRLHEERAWLDASPDADAVPLELVGEELFEWVVPWLLAHPDMDFGLLGFSPRSRGMRQALWRTIRDLQEAQVDPAIAMRAVREGLFEETSRDRLTQVFGLQAAVIEWSRHSHVGRPDDLAQSVIPWVSRSPFLSKLSHVLYYGFYDLTQVQLSLLEEISRVRSVTVFFPLQANPDFRFSQRFLERYLMKGSVIHTPLDYTEDPSPSTGQEWASPPFVQVGSAVGAQGELLCACKIMGHLIESEGFRWEEIGLVARSLEAYTPFLTRIFQEHRLPFSTTAMRDLLEEPLAKTWWLLAGLRQDDFPASAVMDIVTSPFYVCGQVEWSRSMQAEAHWWRRLVRHAGILGGKSDWERLAKLAEDASFIQEAIEAHVLPSHTTPNDLRAFVGEIQRLMDEADRCPASGPVEEFTDFFEQFLETHLPPPRIDDESGDGGEGDSRVQEVLECFRRIMMTIRQWNRLGESSTEASWVRRFRELLEEAHIPLAGQSQVGVQVMDAMAVRGYTFRALFIVGMNDQVFPRVIREDAFLRDRDRRVLAESLGFKIDEKLNGLDEEVLLFTLLRQSAKERLYLLYQRADKQGGSLMPSSLIAEDLRHAEGTGPSPIHLPLGLKERHRVFSGSGEDETPQEIRIISLLLGLEVPGECIGEPAWQTVFRSGLKAGSIIERSEGRAGPFDGIVSSGHDYWRTLQERGFSPSFLEGYARCPMRFWMEEILGTRETRETPTRELPWQVWGRLGHEVLAEVYARLGSQGWPQAGGDLPEVKGLVRSVLHQKSLAYTLRHGNGYWLLWENMMRRLGDVIGEVIAGDREDCVAQAWNPVAFEVEANGVWPGLASGPERRLPIYGRLDRVDMHQNGTALRVVDYKFSWSRAKKTNDPDLIVEAGQGKRLQPPLYALMTEFPSPRLNVRPKEEDSPVQEVVLRFIRPFQDPSTGRASFSQSSWGEESGRELARRVDLWLKGIQLGKFFLVSGVHCQGCSWAGSCRSQHYPSWSRVQRLPLARAFRLLKKQPIDHD